MGFFHKLQWLSTETPTVRLYPELFGSAPASAVSGDLAIEAASELPGSAPFVADLFWKAPDNTTNAPSSPITMTWDANLGSFSAQLPSFKQGEWLVCAQLHGADTILAYGMVYWQDSYGILCENASSAANLSDQAQEAAKTGASILGNNRFFQYLSGGSGAKSRLWYRNDANDAWLGYYIVYANTTTDGDWPPATPVWPTDRKSTRLNSSHT